MYIHLDREKVVGYSTLVSEEVIQDPATRKLDEAVIPVGFEKNYREYSWINEALVYTGQTEEDRLYELENAKEEKLRGYNKVSTLDIGGKIFSTKREDILKYQEATEITKNAGGTEVDLLLNDQVVTLTITEAEEAINSLANFAMQEFWRKHRFVTSVKESGTIEELELVTED